MTRTSAAFEDTWREAYARLAAEVPRLAAAARPLLAGFAACVDKLLDLHEIAPRLAEHPEAPARRFLEALMTRAAAGRGGEILVDWPAGPAFLAPLAQGSALGGTAAQAAWALARLGAPAIIALGDRSADQLAVLDPATWLADGDGKLRRAGETAPEGEGKPAHYIVEYTAGRPLPGLVPTRSTRIIVRFADEDIERDAAFRAYGRGHGAGAGAALLSGPNAVPPGPLEAALDELADAAAEWRAAGIGLVHLELGEFAMPGTREAVLERLAGSVTSVGMNRSELRSLMPGVDEREALAALAWKLGARRAVMHADEWALAATCGDPDIERDALAAGCLLASARAQAGRPVAAPKATDDAAFLPPPMPLLERRDGWSFVACPAPYLAQPRSTIGLGDTFTAGTMLVHCQPQHQPILAGLDAAAGPFPLPA